MLPYASIAEAEVALGARPLSSMESLWLRYTASVPDSCVYHVNVLLVFAVFNLAPLPALLLDLRAPTSAAVRRYKLQPAANNAPSAIFRCYKTVMLTFFTVVLPLHLISYPFVEYVGIRTSLPLPSPWEILAQLTVYFLIEDYGHYWIHRWLHTEWAFTNIHYMHHQFTAPVGFAAPYAHWAEILLLGLPSFVGPSLVPGHVITLWLWFALRQMEAIEIHSGYKFSWVPTKLIPLYGGSEYHDYHHFVGRKSHSNFASIFVYCDYIYGTNKVFAFHEEMKIFDFVEEFIPPTTSH